MKIICFNLEECAHTYIIPFEELKDYDLTNPFVKCSQCSSLALVAKDDFDLHSIKQEHLISSLLKLSKRK